MIDACAAAASQDECISLVTETGAAKCAYYPAKHELKLSAITNPSCTLKCDSELRVEGLAIVGFSALPPYFGDGRTTVKCSGGGGQPASDLAAQGT